MIKTVKDVRAAAASGVMVDEDVLALTLWGESRGETNTGRIAVACVIRNRAKSKSWFGDGISGVCLKHWQFSCWLQQGGKDNCRQVMKMANSSHTARLKISGYRACYQIAKDICGGVVEDQVKRANHYYVHGTRKPQWAVGQKPVLQVGSHIFFKL